MRSYRAVSLVVFVALAALCLQPSTGHTGPHVLSRVQVDKVTVDLKSDKDASDSINVFPTIISNGDYVTVKYYVASPSKDDWIGVYSPSTEDVTQKAPVKYQMASKSPGFLTTGAGQLKFRLVNMRADYTFVLFTGGLKTPTAIAKSSSVTFKWPNEPLRPRIALTEDPTAIVIQWSSESTVSPVVQFGTSQSSLGNAQNGTSFTYSDKDMCGPPATTTGYRSPGTINTVRIASLTQGQTYYYRFGDSSANVWSTETYSFTIPRSSAYPFKFITFGDMGQSSLDDSLQASTEAPSVNTTHRIAADMSAGLAHAVFHIGDISYARGYAALWDQFFDQIAPVAGRIPWMVEFGNHERDYPKSGSLFNGTDSGGECGTAMFSQFYTPTSCGPSTTVTGACQDQQRRPWYSINTGPVHVVFMSTEHDFSSGSEQLKWIETDLARVDRTATPWVIFTGHRPMYIDSTNFSPPDGDQPVAVLLRKYVEPLLYQNKVDLALWGHHHSYQRQCAVYQTECKARAGSDRVYRGPWQATVQMVIGMAGMGLSGNIMNPQPDYTEFVDVKSYGYTRVNIANATALHMEYVSDADGSIIDDFWIMRD